MFGDLSNEFKGRKFCILLFPCNQFLGQEPTSPKVDEVQKHCKNDVLDLANVTLFGKIEVNGAKASPVFEFLRYNSKLYKEEKNLSTPIPWNFAKFLVDSNGGVFNHYSPKVTDLTIKEDIRDC